MNFEKELFEKKGLKIDKDRVLTYSQLSCPLDCKYCFVEDINYNQNKDAVYLEEEQFELLEKLPEEVKLIMLGCDTEFFQSKEHSLQVLERLSGLNKDLSVITKLHLSKDFIDKIREIDLKMREHNNFLSFSISLSGMESVKKWEPKAPAPANRIETLKMAHEASLMTMLAVRPLLPSTSDEELEDLVMTTKDYCEGYYSGPLYLKSLDTDLIDKNDESLSTTEEQPHWMPRGNVFYKILKIGQMDNLKKLLSKYNKPLFEGAAEGMRYLKKYEKH